MSSQRGFTLVELVVVVVVLGILSVGTVRFLNDASDGYAGTVSRTELSSAARLDRRTHRARTAQCATEQRAGSWQLRRIHSGRGRIDLCQSARGHCGDDVRHGASRDGRRRAQRAQCRVSRQRQCDLLTRPTGCGLAHRGTRSTRREQHRASDDGGVASIPG
ncbi:MAG: prepilin-type N-terminal cleavage/methylation domain-containing protein [Gammaproteobacteria bacterium]|nr:prepilin-type N-terminal cleavage/methylation domain-containing protein [Gammaproteobacteria bacterium]